MAAGSLSNPNIEILTRTQSHVFDFIQDFFKQKGYSPTAKEIAEGIGIKSRGVVHRYLKALALSGFIQLIPNRHRNIRLCNNFRHTSPFPRQLPLIGTIVNGLLERIEQHQSIDIVSIFLATNHFAIRVQGDAMNSDGIVNGDVLLCEQVESVRNGQTVVAFIDNQKVVLKRIHYNSDKTITLSSINDELPIVYPAEKIKIQGIYLGLIRLSQSIIS